MAQLTQILTTETGGLGEQLNHAMTAESVCLIHCPLAELVIDRPAKAGIEGDPRITGLVDSVVRPNTETIGKRDGQRCLHQVAISRCRRVNCRSLRAAGPQSVKLELLRSPAIADGVCQCRLAINGRWLQRGIQRGQLLNSLHLGGGVLLVLREGRGLSCGSGCSRSGWGFRCRGFRSRCRLGNIVLSFGVRGSPVGPQCGEGVSTQHCHRQAQRGQVLGKFHCGRLLFECAKTGGQFRHRSTGVCAGRGKCDLS